MKDKRPDVYFKRIYIRKLIVWLLLCAGGTVLLYMYYSGGEATSSPTYAVALLGVIAGIVFYAMKLPLYFFDRPFTGTVREVKLRRVAVSDAIGGKVSKLRLATAVAVTVDTDKGNMITREYHMRVTGVVPYEPGDRVMQMRGSPYLCRFPRTKNDDVINIGEADTGEQKPEEGRRSIVCPVCGACNSLGQEECFDCGYYLPEDKR